jgi:hypothetical protein
MNQVRIQSPSGAEGIIYPNGYGAFAIGTPDGYALLDGQELELRLGSIWIAGTIVCFSHAAPIFVAHEDQNICGLHAGMRVLLHRTQEESDTRSTSTIKSSRRKTCRAGAGSRQKKETMPCSK